MIAHTVKRLTKNKNGQPETLNSWPKSKNG